MLPPPPKPFGVSINLKRTRFLSGRCADYLWITRRSSALELLFNAFVFISICSVHCSIHSNLYNAYCIRGSWRTTPVRRATEYPTRPSCCLSQWKKQRKPVATVFYYHLCPLSREAALYSSRPKRRCFKHHWLYNPLTSEHQAVCVQVTLCLCQSFFIMYLGYPPRMLGCGIAPNITSPYQAVPRRVICFVLRQSFLID